ncbi:MAG: 3-deoxy-D-manno-octulosonic acid transferase [Gemmataceae bacterium]
MFFYSLGLLVAIILSAPYWLFRMARSGRYRDGLAQRLGAISPSLRKFVGNRPAIWIHAVSVGELMAAGPLIEKLDGLDASIPVVISTTTRTGQKLAWERFGTQKSRDGRVFYYPLDFAWIVRRYLRLLKPRILVLMESELWPRMIAEADRARVPIVVVNGRISNRSLPRHRALRGLWRPFLRKLTLVLAQSEQDERRFVEIGVPARRVQTAGNLKYDVRVAEELAITAQMRAHLPDRAQVVVAGSVLEGEERLVLQAFQELLSTIPNLVLILAPRHPERFPAVVERIESIGLPGIRRSVWASQPRPIPPGSVFLLDSMGELASVYSLASVAFVGGSLIPAGGHNPLEPAQFGVPIVMGPFTENFRGIVAALLEREAIRVMPPERLAEVVAEILDAADAPAMGARARRVFEEYAGASEVCLAAIRRVLAPADATARQATEVSG